MTSLAPAPTVVLPATATRDEWLATRRQGLGGSDVAAAVGLNPWMTPYQLWLDKTDRAPIQHDDAALERMRWGSALEPLLLREFDDAHPELILTGPEGTYGDPSAPWRLVNPDAMLCDTAGCHIGIVEAKTGSHRAVAGWADDAVPVHYICQVQWYLDVLGLPGAWMVALLDTSTYLERWVPHDPEIAQMLTEQAATFWQAVQADEPPPPDASDDTARMLAAVPATRGQVIELDRSWRQTITEYGRLGGLIRELEAERKALGNRLRAALDTAEEAWLDGAHVATFRAPKPKPTCDLSRLASDYPEAYAACVSPAAAGRRLTVTGPKET